MDSAVQQHFDVAIIGGGILGLAHAWMAAERGLDVVLFERDQRAAGASVRNFGMIWPIGQTVGELHELAMQSRQFWLQLKSRANVWVNECGSIHLARNDDEVAVLEEFVAEGSRCNEIQMLTAADVSYKSKGANRTGLLAGLWSDSELCVNPRTAIEQLHRWLESEFKVRGMRGTTICRVEGNVLRPACGTEFLADRIVICSGSDFETLFPCHYRNAGLIKCKLQMLATGPQPRQWQLGPHLAGGLTLRHYRSFEKCPSISRLRERIQRESPLLDKYGIHVMASQNDAGEVILGDSHVYGDDISPFDCAQIDELIIGELKQLIAIPDFTIQRRWHGIYAKHPEQAIVLIEPQPNCRIVTAPGGAGMTLAFGLANRTWKDW